MYKLDKVVCLKHIAAEEGVSLSYCSRSEEARRISARKLTQIENCMELWKVLSEIEMLSYLRIEMCTMKPFIETDVCS